MEVLSTGPDLKIEGPVSLSSERKPLNSQKTEQKETIKQPWTHRADKSLIFKFYCSFLVVFCVQERNWPPMPTNMLHLNVNRIM